MNLAVKKSLFLFLLFLFSLVQVKAQAPAADYFLLVGTYTDTKSEGIYVYRFNPVTNKFTYVSTAKAENPSYLAISPNKKIVYAVNENGDNKGTISSFTFNNKTGALKQVSKQPTNGSHPCYVDVDASGKNVVATNYSSGDFVMYKSSGDGSLTPAVQTIKDEGSGAVADRQEGPHVHSAQFSPDGSFVFVADLGNDRLYKYNFYPESPSEVLTPGAPAFYSLPAGSGPRHFAFHPNRKYCYLLNELSGKLVAYSYAQGELKELQSVASDKTAGENNKGCADIHLTPNGKFLYTTNRVTSNEIVAYKVEVDGKLTEVARYKTGTHPRNFVIDPSGKFLLVANRDSNSIVLYKINQETGKLDDTKVSLTVDKPVCLKMIRTVK
ncbi:lactonase family protein [Solitalea sp. MAHUQ-68]|uniref:Lactonase family protein n=1 Tax=Solitalea agri TaxID=2953739 RepID=A0A9X2F5S9_9SPHI|nr:lactonase family protein [Solitalea agri]MCO4292413.1 lactonase family protein [Solitalea agri]